MKKILSLLQDAIDSIDHAQDMLEGVEAEIAAFGKEEYQRGWKEGRDKLVAQVKNPEDTHAALANSRRLDQGFSPTRDILDHARKAYWVADSVPDVQLADFRGNISFAPHSVAPEPPVDLGPAYEGGDAVWIDHWTSGEPGLSAVVIHVILCGPGKYVYNLRGCAPSSHEGFVEVNCPEEDLALRV